MEYIRRPADYDYFNDPDLPLLGLIVDSESLEHELGVGNPDASKIL